MTITHKINTKDFFERAIRNTKLDIQRETLLDNIANKIVKKIYKNKEVNINFICTHNSRRSQFAQVWAYFATEYYKINNINCFSSGTNKTAFYTGTLNALESAGFKFSLEEFSHKNPKYIISVNEANSEIICYSKLIEDPINETPFVAITTCGNADENCPVILDAIARFHLPYKDPKWSDDEDNEKEVYLNTSKVIAGEIGILFRKIKEQLS